VADAFEVSHQSGQTRAEQAAALDRQGQAAVVDLVTARAVSLVEAVLLDVQRDLGYIDLLKLAFRRFCKPEALVRQRVTETPLFFAL
jgi:hypothetical protein